MLSPFVLPRWSAKLVFIAFSLLGLLPIASAGVTDITSVPMTGTGTAVVKPNIMLLMDTSRSMGFTHMPDELEGAFDALPIGYASYQCNSIYYNPTSTYKLPKDSTGVNLPTPQFSAASYNYYILGTATVVDLASQFKPYDSDTRAKISTDNYAPLAQQAYYYVYSGTQTLNYKTNPCTQADTGAKDTAGDIAATGGGIWKRKLVSATSGPGATDERQNFANWYTYYRTRMAMTKSALSLSFANITDKYRVGFITANPGTPVVSSTFIALNDFSASNKAAWYAKVFSQVPFGSSPMREGLARVGRYYANKHDGINVGMAGDPMQHACQKNYTLMTTDGYWNTAAETVGPVQLDGLTLVGQQDGNLADPNSPRPIYDGTATALRTTTNKSNTYSQADCQGLYAWMATSQVIRTDSRFLQSTVQNLQNTQQNLQSTSQQRQVINQFLKSTSVQNSETTQTVRNTRINLQSTVQNRVTTVQKFLDTSIIRQVQTQQTKWTQQRLQSTSQILKSTSQTRATTSIQTKTTQQNKQSSALLQKTVRQTLQSTQQNFQTAAQLLKTTTQSGSKSTTSPLLKATSQWVRTSKTTSQTVAINALLESTTPVQSCTPSTVNRITCGVVNTGPTVTDFASCVTAGPSASNNWTQITCTETPSGTCTGSDLSCHEVLVPAASAAACTNGGPTAANNYTTTTCTPAVSLNVLVGAGTCAAQSPTAGNGFTTITCSAAIQTGPTAGACTAQAATAPNWIATTCSYAAPVTSAVAVCTIGGPTAANGYVNVTACPAPVVTTNVPVQNCSTGSAAAANNYTATTCPTVTNVTTTGTACLDQAALSTNNWTSITCSSAAAVVTNVAACVASGPGSANGYATITCPAPVTTTTQGVACTSAAPDASNSFTSTTCGFTAPVTAPASSCTLGAGTAANGYVQTTACPAPIVTTNVPAASCAVSGPTAANSYTTTSCPAPIVTTNVPVANCTAASANAGNLFTATTCPAAVITATQTGVACTAVAPVAPQFIATLCGQSPPVTTNVAVCVASGPTAANGYTTTTCPAAILTHTPVLTCAPIAPTAANNFITTSCPADVVLTEPIGICAASGPTAPNYITTSCPAPLTTTNVAVAVCTASAATAGNSWTTTSCPAPTTTSTPVLSGSCTTSGASAANGYMSTTCANPPATNATIAVAPGTCVASGPSAANNFVTTSCPVPGVTTVGIPAACVPSPATAGNGWTTTTCPAALATDQPAASCTASGPTAANQYTTTACPIATTTNVGIPTACAPSNATAANSYVRTTCPAPVNQTVFVAACTPVPPTAANEFKTVSCPAPSVTSNVAVLSCMPSGPTAANNFITTSCPSPTSVATPVGTCSNVAPTLDNNYTTSTCSTVSTPPTRVLAASCSPVAAAAGNNFSAVACAPETGTKFQVQTVTTEFSNNFRNGVLVSTSTTSISTSTLAEVDGVCHVPPDSPATPTAQPTLPLGCGAWPCVVNVGNPATGSSNSLADVAQYYYINDLRPEMSNDVKPGGVSPEGDFATHQHMTTFGLGLGTPGTLSYDSKYQSNTTGTFAQIRAGTESWPAWPDLSLDYTSGAAYNDPRSIDDFWHASVNGRGLYFSANAADEVEAGLKETFDAINKAAGAGGGAAVSNGAPVASDNTAYIASYATVAWSGDLQARKIDISTGQITTTFDWSASAELNKMRAGACDNRNIFIRRSGATNDLANFSWGTQKCDTSGAPTGGTDTGLNSTEQGYFDSVAVTRLSQYAEMTDGSGSTVNQRNAAQGQALVNFIRGQNGLEGFVANDLSKLYRGRASAMGDIVGSVATVVKAPLAEYDEATNPGYGAFKTSNGTRNTMLYIGSNGGMVHAIRAATGVESWAYIPSVVMPELYRLADANYSINHRYFVDGTPSSGDIFDGTNWKTIVVGGLNAGGKGYYALDVTNPDTPKSLWEFNLGSTCASTTPTVSLGSDCDIGLTFGKPVITKLVDGTWVVLVTSGYNNTSGDGKGHLYVLNANTGNIITKLDTTVGTAVDPSGLREVNNYVANGVRDNTTLRVYGGDLKGNVWRFDINDNLAPAGKEATLVATLKDPSGTAQPITTRVQLAEVDGRTMVVAGTGQFLGSSDMETSQVQSVYGFKDNLGTTTIADIRSTLRHIELTVQTGTTTTRIAACTGTSTCALTEGWVVDLPESGERVNVDPFIVGSTVVFASNIPGNSACVPTGHSWINFVSLLNGEAVASSPDAVVSKDNVDSLAVGLGYVVLPDGTVKGIRVFSDTRVKETEIPVEPPNPRGKRVSWREIKKQ
jgi:Tfp pilus tip-associated adhesin PilY1